MRSSVACCTTGCCAPSGAPATASASATKWSGRFIALPYPEFAERSLPPHCPATLTLRLLCRLRSRYRFLRGRLRLAWRRARQRNLRLRLVLRARGVCRRTNLLCAFDGAIDSGAIDRRLEFRLQHRSQRLRHGHWLRLPAENTIDERLDAVRGQPFALRRRLRAVRELLWVNAELLPEHAHELRELRVELGLVLGAQRDLGTVCFLEHHFALRDRRDEATDHRIGK